MTYDPTLIRVRNGWAVVLMDERQELLSSGIFLPTVTQAEKLTEGSATIIRLGAGEKADRLGLAPGMRICLRSYLKHANVIPTDEAWPSGQPKEYFILNLDDILVVMDAGVQVGVFSRPAMSAVENVDAATGNVKMKR